MLHLPKPVWAALPAAEPALPHPRSHLGNMGTKGSPVCRQDAGVSNPLEIAGLPRNRIPVECFVCTSALWGVRRMTSHYRLFVASPGDVKSERETLSRVVTEINQTHGSPPLGYSLEILRWETHATPGGGRPQGVINEQIGNYDLFVGIMWRRFGTPTGVAGSGTEEEYRRAYSSWERNNPMPLMFYFCQRPFMPRQIDEVDQLKSVLLFRQELERKALVWDYAGPKVFADEIRKHLCLRMERLVDARGHKSRATPDNESIDDLRALWDHMVPELQKAFSVAYNENRRAGDPGIQTRDLFAAMLRVAPEQLASIVKEIPQGALPEAVSGPIAEQPYVVEERPWLERKALVWDYAGPKVFADEIRKHLCLRMERLVDARDISRGQHPIMKVSTT